MARITIDLPGLEPHEAKDMLVIALNEWRQARSDGDYVEKRYGHLSSDFRFVKMVRLTKQFVALDHMNINTSKDETGETL